MREGHGVVEGLRFGVVYEGSVVWASLGFSVVYGCGVV